MTEDNSEEIVFDRVLVPICDNVGTGNKLSGVLNERCSDEFLTVLGKADIVISKGQANFESIEGSKL